MITYKIHSFSLWNEIAFNRTLENVQVLPGVKHKGWKYRVFLLKNLGIIIIGKLFK
jgi:hypothetical protein